MQKFVDAKPLKRLASELLGSNSMLRRVLLSENDVMPATEFVAALRIYLFLLREEFK
ncbi:MAG: hypothetical protein LYZ69_03900 [Nitrososphaerales archaeon]|nr:hypothetical protein [Nitrososphaerales archaeon]